MFVGDDPDSGALIDVLADPEIGAFEDEYGPPAAFLAARHPADVILVHVAGDPGEVVGALDGCPSTHVLVISEREIAAEPKRGRAFLTGAPTRAVARALLSGRADKDKDGDVTVRELYQRLRQNHQPRLRSSLDTAFVIARYPREQPEAPAPHKGSQGLSRLLAGAGAALLVGALWLPWLYGGSGARLAFASGTAWPNRLAALAGLALALGALLFALGRLKPAWVVVLAAITYGALLGLLERWTTDADYGLGYVLTALAPLPILYAARAGLRPETGAASVGGGLITYQLVGPGSYAGLFFGFVFLAFGSWAVWHEDDF